MYKSSTNFEPLKTGFRPESENCPRRKLKGKFHDGSCCMTVKPGERERKIATQGDGKLEGVNDKSRRHNIASNVQHSRLPR
jgi:hypothetical protein